MRKVRLNTFETNSSSMHSLQICNTNKWSLPSKKQLEEYIDGDTLYIEGGEFGWGYSVLRTPLGKMSYIATEIVRGEEEPKLYLSKQWREFEDAIKSRIKGVKKVRMKKSNDKYYPFGYIDHQSFGTIDAERKGASLEEIIFSDKYYIVIDNDNH